VESRHLCRDVAISYVPNVLYRRIEEQVIIFGLLQRAPWVSAVRLEERYQGYTAPWHRNRRVACLDVCLTVYTPFYGKVSMLTRPRAPTSRSLFWSRTSLSY
jgi:hypothetical protein